MQKSILIAIIVSSVVVVGVGIGLGVYFETRKSSPKHKSPKAKPSDDKKDKAPVQVVCKDTLKNGAKIDSDGKIIGFQKKVNNSCVDGCSNDLKACNDICVAGGYDKYFSNQDKSLCVKKLNCPNTIVTSNDCNENAYCVNNVANLDKLKVPLENDTNNWKCVAPENEAVWKTSCRNAGGNWLLNQKFCWISKPGCIDYTTVDTKDAKATLDVYVSSDSLQNDINISHDLIWTITLSPQPSNSATSSLTSYTYNHPSVIPSSMAAACSTTCTPCDKVGLAIYLYSEGNTPSIDVKQNFGVSIQANLKSDPDIVVAKTGPGVPSLTIFAQLGSFSGPVINSTNAVKVAKNIDSLEGLEGADAIKTIDPSLKQQIKNDGGIAYEYDAKTNPDAVLVPCTEAFCTDATSFGTKFIVLAWNSIPQEIINKAVKSDPCISTVTVTKSGVTPVVLPPDVWYWVGLVDTSQNADGVMKQIYLQKGGENNYLMYPNAKQNTTVTFQIVAVLTKAGKQPPDMSDGLSRVSCRSKATTVVVDVTPYTDQLCRNFKPQQVVGEILGGDSEPIPNYAWAQNGRCVWGGTNQESYQNYACLFDDVEKSSIPKKPDPSKFRLFNDHSKKCEEAIAYQGGSQSALYDSPQCVTPLKDACTTGAKSGNITYTCPNMIGFDGSSNTIDGGEFTSIITEAMDVARRRNGLELGDFDTSIGRQKAFSNLIKKDCPPLQNSSCVDKNDVLQTSCSSNWATMTCDPGDSKCLSVLKSAGVRDCKGNDKCVTNTLSDWNCLSNGTNYICNQTRDKCFAFTTDDKGVIQPQPNDVCCSAHGYAFKQGDGEYKCWGTIDGSGDNPCIVNSDKSTYTSTAGNWPECNLPVAPPKPVCTIDQFYEASSNTCVAKPTCNNNLQTYDENTNLCVPRICGNGDCCDGGGSANPNLNCAAENCRVNCTKANEPTSSTGFPNCVQSCDLITGYDRCNPIRRAPLPNCTNFCSHDKTACTPVYVYGTGLADWSQIQAGPRLTWSGNVFSNDQIGQTKLINLMKDVGPEYIIGVNSVWYSAAGGTGSMLMLGPKAVVFDSSTNSYTWPYKTTSDPNIIKISKVWATNNFNPGSNKLLSIAEATGTAPVHPGYGTTWSLYWSDK